MAYRCHWSYCKREAADELSWLCPVHAEQHRPAGGPCGWGGGARDDPAPCPEPCAAGRFLCDRHSALVGRAARKRFVPPQEPAPVTVRQVEPDPPDADVLEAVAAGRDQTECKRGHSLTDPANVRLGAGGRRVCRACRREREAERRRKAQEAEQAAA